MKKISTIFMLLLVAQITYAAEDECPAAVEVAEAQNPNAYKNCDYSQKGLNGVLHRALVKKSESSEDTTEEKHNNKESAKVSEKNQKLVSKTEPLKEGEFGSGQQLQSLKFALVEKLALECTKGFVVEGERYAPIINGGAMKLELIYHCL